MSEDVRRSTRSNMTPKSPEQTGNTSDDLAAQGALAEFTTLRTEALQAFSTQSNIVALQLTATSVVFSFALTNRSRTGFLLIIPVVCYVLNGRYLRAERLVRLIGEYIMADLSPRVNGGLRWEFWLRGKPSPKQVLRWSAHGPLIFSAISIFALIWLAPYMLSAHNISSFNRVLLELIWISGLALTLLSIYMIKVVFIGSLSVRGLIKFFQKGESGQSK
jgi:hypothetical protein